MVTHFLLKRVNGEFCMVSQLVFFSPDSCVITSDLAYAELKYPGEINNTLVKFPIPSKTYCLYVDNHFSC